MAADKGHKRPEEYGRPSFLTTTSYVTRSATSWWFSFISFQFCLVSASHPLFFENCYAEPNNINPFLRMIDCNYWCRYLQGDPNQNFKCVLAITQKLCISDPMLVKPKCVWEAYNFFDFQLFVYNFSKKLYASQTHFGFTNMGTEMHSFRVIA